MDITIEVSTNAAQKKYEAEQRLLGKMYDTSYNDDYSLYNELYETLVYIRSFYNNQPSKVVFSNKTE